MHPKFIKRITKIKSFKILQWCLPLQNYIKLSVLIKLCFANKKVGSVKRAELPFQAVSLLLNFFCTKTSFRKKIYPVYLE